MPRVTCKDGEFKPSDELINGWMKLYPELDIFVEIEKANMWSICNPSKMKTKRGCARFLNGWLNRAKPEANNVTANQDFIELHTDKSWRDGL